MQPIAPPAPAEARAFLATTALFSVLGPSALDSLAGELEWLMVPGGTCVCRQGEEGDALYLVASGRLAVLREGAGGDGVVGQKGRGDSFGEMAVLTGHRRSATVRALRDCVLARLSRERAVAVLRAHPDALLALTRTLASLLEREPVPPAGGCIAVALLAAGREVDLVGFARALAASLAGIAPTLHLDGRGLDERFGAGAAGCADGTLLHGAITAWLAEQEARHGLVLYEADAGPSPWTRRCLRQADHIVVVADAGAEPGLGALTAELEALEQDQGRQLEQLVLLHDPATSRPCGTAPWLPLRPWRRHLHVRRGNAADLARVSRFLAGRAVGLVLGGGGARGFAHIGVVRALAEAGIPIDRIGGTSMGAVLAAQHACGNDWRQMAELNFRGWVQMAPQKRVYTLPLISVLATHKADRMLAMMFGDRTIEDLWLPFFCVSTNITRTEVMVHREGPVIDAVFASMAIPGVTPPVVHGEGDLLVDGGVLDNLPVSTMRKLGPGPIIASDASATHDLRADPSYRRTPSPWRLLAESFRPRARRRAFPNILRLVHRSALLASDVYAKGKKGEVELYLDLPLDGYDMFQMEALDRLAEVGYEFTRARLAEGAAAALGVPAVETTAERGS
jgi:predicted acylesterase/phospholipase RssA